MAVVESEYTWTCDWCGVKTKTPIRDLPGPWVLNETDLLQYKARHLCSENCWKTVRHADVLAHELAKEAVRMVQHRWAGKTIEDIPEPDEVDLAFVIDGVVIQEKE
jgi:hypothetical protein